MGIFDWAKRKSQPETPAPQPAPSTRPTPPAQPAAKPAEPGPNPDAADAEFDDLVARARAGDRAAEQTMWKRTFQLPQWHFLPGIPPQDVMKAMSEGRNFGPMIGGYDQGRWVYAFTSSSRAQAAAKKNGFELPDGGSVVLDVKNPGAIATCVRSIEASQLSGVLFNPGSDAGSYFTTRAGLLIQCEYFRDEVATGFWHQTLGAMVEANSNPAWQRLARRVMLCEEWYIFDPAKCPGIPRRVRDGDGFTMPVFTSVQSLEATLKQRAPDLAFTQGMVICIPSKQGLEFVKSLRSDAVAPVSGACFDLDLQPFVLSIDQLEQAAATLAPHRV